MDAEIDLRHYLQVLVKRWALVRDAVILALVAALVTTQLTVSATTPVFEAIAGVALKGDSVEVVLQDDLNKQVAAPTMSTIPLAKRNALAALVDNPRIAERVAQQMGDRLPPELQSPAALLQVVEGRTPKDTDIVQIAVRGRDPDLTVDIANAWAAAYEQEINTSDVSPNATIIALEREQASLWNDYEKASQALASHIATSRLNELTNDIEDCRRAIDTLRTLRLGSLTTLIEARLSLDPMLQAAQTLRMQAEQPGTSASTSGLAIALLKAQLAAIDQQTSTTHGELATTGPLSGTIQLPATNRAPSSWEVQVMAPSTDGSTIEAQMEDLDALIETLKARSSELDAAIGIQSRQVVGASDENTKTPVVSILNDLRRQLSQLEAAALLEKATHDELVRARDLAWDAYSAVARRLRQVTLNSRLPDGQVQFNVAAIGATRVDSQRVSRSMALLLAGIMGLLAGTFGVIAIEALYPTATTPAIPWTAPARWVFRRFRRTPPSESPKQPVMS